MFARCTTLRGTSAARAMPSSSRPSLTPCRISPTASLTMYFASAGVARSSRVRSMSSLRLREPVPLAVAIPWKARHTSSKLRGTPKGDNRCPVSNIICTLCPKSTASLAMICRCFTLVCTTCLTTRDTAAPLRFSGRPSRSGKTRPMIMRAAGATSSGENEPRYAATSAAKDLRDLVASSDSPSSANFPNSTTRASFALAPVDETRVGAAPHLEAVPTARSTEVNRNGQHGSEH